MIFANGVPAGPPNKAGWPWTTKYSPIAGAISSAELPRFTIVTPSFNQVQYIEETIRSVLLQGYPNLQYIIIDGDSTDGSQAIIRKYEPWLDYWVTEPDGGQTEAINKGFTKADGDWMGWLNSDDILLPGALEQVARTAIENPTVNWVVGITEMANAEMVVEKKFTPIVSHWQSELIRKTEISWLDFVWTKWSRTQLPQPSSFWSREAWSKTGPLDESLCYVMDYEYWIRLARTGFLPKIVYQPLAVFRVQAQSKTAEGVIPFWLEKQDLIGKLMKDSSTDEKTELERYNQWLDKRIRLMKRRQRLRQLPVLGKLARIYRSMLPKRKEAKVA